MIPNIAVKENNKMQQTTHFKVMKTLDEGNRKPKLKHVQSAVDNTIQVDSNKRIQVRSAIKNNNFTRASFPSSGDKNQKPGLRATPSMVMQNQTGNLVYLCSNHDILPDH